MITRGLVLSAAAVALLASLPGCQTARRTFQVDHRAQVPARELGTTPRDEAAAIAHSRPTEESLRNARPVDVEPEKAPAGEGTWSRLFGGTSKPKPLPLPRTDLPPEDVFEEPTPAHRIPDGF